MNLFNLLIDFINSFLQDIHQSHPNLHHPFIFTFPSKYNIQYRFHRQFTVGGRSYLVYHSHLGHLQIGLNIKHFCDLPILDLNYHDIFQKWNGLKSLARLAKGHCPGTHMECFCLTCGFEDMSWCDLMELDYFRFGNSNGWF